MKTIDPLIIDDSESEDEKNPAAEKTKRQLGIFIKHEDYLENGDLED